MKVHPDVQKLAKQVAEIGFTLEPELNQAGNAVFRHTSGYVHTIGPTPSDHRAVKNALAQMEKYAGKKVRRVNHRRSRKKVEMAGFIETIPSENAEHWATRIEHLIGLHKNLVIEIQVLAMEPVTNKDLNKAARRLRRIAEIEHFLDELKQPYKPLVSEIKLVTNEVTPFFHSPNFQ